MVIDGVVTVCALSACGPFRTTELRWLLLCPTLYVLSLVLARGSCATTSTRMDAMNVFVLTSICVFAIWGAWKHEQASCSAQASHVACCSSSLLSRFAWLLSFAFFALFCPPRSRRPSGSSSASPGRRAARPKLQGRRGTPPVLQPPAAFVPSSPRP